MNGRVIFFVHIFFKNEFTFPVHECLFECVCVCVSIQWHSIKNSMIQKIGLLNITSFFFGFYPSFIAYNQLESIHQQKRKKCE